MEATDDILVEIDDLYVNFYTYQGVVQAIQGVDLVIRKGETLGLVGETGCGKSVTASTIMKLVLSPPGKIEAGSIYFMEPPEVRAARKAYEAKAQEWWNSLSKEQKARMMVTHGMRFTGFKKRVKPLSPAEAKKITIPDKVPSKIAAMYMADMAKKLPRTDRTVQDALRKTYDLVPKSNEYMQKIRGKWISMIFQEPTTALNPVFTAGDQIAEVILLHRRAEMASRALKRVKAELGAAAGKGRPRRVRAKKGKLKCSHCGSEVKKDAQWCSSCGRQFHGPVSWFFKRMAAKTTLTMLERIVKKPDAPEFYLGKIPVVNQYKKEMYREALREATNMLRTVRIPDPEGVASRYPHELSGGMQQRVMIAIALACNPKLLIADEPTTALDVTIQGQILKLMRDLKAEFGSSILLITHNLGVVAEMCDRVGVMYAGDMAEVAPARIIFKSPLHPYTSGLMKAVPSVQMDAKELYSIRGSVPNLIRPPPGCRFHPRCDYAREYCKRVKPELIEIEPDHFVSCHMVAKAEGYVHG